MVGGVLDVWIGKWTETGRAVVVVLVYGRCGYLSVLK